MSLADTLNTQQQKAAEAGDGPVLIVAGPGTGKTKTLTARIAYLIEKQQVKAQEILALTFTNKAAREMRDRLAARLSSRKGDEAKLTIVTFHALAYKMLGEAQKGSRLVTQTERAAIIRSLKKHKAIKQATVRELSLLVSRAKNHLQPADDDSVRALVAAYNTELASQNLYDFDDLLLKLYTFLHQSGNNAQYQHILVDEFQDTNDLQYELLKLLNTTENLFVIGDPLQSIYGFRGASSQVFDRFKTDWPAATEITLTINYRSAPQIVTAAGAVFPNAPLLQAHRSQPGKVVVLEVLNEYGEAEWVVNEIERQVGGSDMLRSSQHHNSDQQRTFRDFAVLYRTHAAARTVQRTLEATGIPYQVAGEGSPYEQPHIKIITEALAYLASQGEPPVVKGYKPSQIEALLTPLRLAKDVSLPQLVSQIVSLLSLESEKHASSLRQFTNSLVPFEGKPLGAYLEHLQAIAEQEYYDPAADAVTLLTIHAAKGLEFSRVFLIAAQQGILPLLPKQKPAKSSPAKGQPLNIEEDRRLFYVAVTRARDELYMLHARNRQGEQQQISEFISELPPGVAEHVIDPAIANQKRKIERRQQKRSQTSLF